ncbi:MAG TPA: hypothetical protein VFB19_18725 [Mycobacterium sp.]|nr:hypothetical protein [Mycobacterium sp.]
MTTLDTLAAPARLDAAIAAASREDATLDDVAELLRLLTVADPETLAPRRWEPARWDALWRVQGIAAILRGAVLRNSPAVRSAPPSALAAVVESDAHYCSWPDCGNDVHDWTFDGTYCSAECRNADLKERGL